MMLSGFPSWIVLVMLVVVDLILVLLIAFLFIFTAALLYEIVRLLRPSALRRWWTMPPVSWREEWREIMAPMRAARVRTRRILHL